jgi:hypothetical protein
MEREKLESKLTVRFPGRQIFEGTRGSIVIDLIGEYDNPNFELGNPQNVENIVYIHCRPLLCCIDARELRSSRAIRSAYDTASAPPSPVSAKTSD